MHGSGLDGLPNNYNLSSGMPNEQNHVSSAINRILL